jgi:hypothetical protein
MNRASLENRLAKLERLRCPADSLFYLLWHAPEDDAECLVAEAGERGEIAQGDPLVCLPWLGPEPVPVPRWIVNKTDALTRQEEDIMLALCAEKRAAHEWGNGPLGSGDDRPEWFPPTYRRGRHRMVEYTDTELLGLMFAKPVA